MATARLLVRVALVVAALASQTPLAHPASSCAPMQAGEFAFSGCLPRWPATWNISRSTVIMPCNYSGYTDPHSLPSRYGLVDIDWSNAMGLWASERPSQFTSSQAINHAFIKLSLVVCHFGKNIQKDVGKIP